MLKHESCLLGGFGGAALVDWLCYCFNPHFKSGSEVQSKVSDCQEFLVSAQVTGEADRGVLPIKSAGSSPGTTSEKAQWIYSFKNTLATRHHICH